MGTDLSKLNFTAGEEKLLVSVFNEKIMDFYITQYKENTYFHTFHNKAVKHFNSHALNEKEQKSFYSRLRAIFPFDTNKKIVQDAKYILKHEGKDITIFAFFLPLVDGERLELKIVY